MPALERRRLENRSRWEGPGSAKDGTVGVAETPSPMLRAERLLGQAAVFMRCCSQVHTDEGNSKILGCETRIGFSQSDQWRLGLVVEKYALDDTMSE